MPLQDGPVTSPKLSRNKVPSRQRILTFDLDDDDDSWWIDRSLDRFTLLRVPRDRSLVEILAQIRHYAAIFSGERFADNLKICNAFEKRFWNFQLAFFCATWDLDPVKIATIGSRLVGGSGWKWEPLSALHPYPCPFVSFLLTNNRSPDDNLGYVWQLRVFGFSLPD